MLPVINDISLALFSPTADEISSGSTKIGFARYAALQNVFKDIDQLLLAKAEQTDSRSEASSPILNSIKPNLKRALKLHEKLYQQNLRKIGK